MSHLSPTALSMLACFIWGICGCADSTQQVAENTTRGVLSGLLEPQKETTSSAMLAQKKRAAKHLTVRAIRGLLQLSRDEIDNIRLGIKSSSTRTRGGVIEGFVEIRGYDINIASAFTTGEETIELDSLYVGGARYERPNDDVTDEFPAGWKFNFGTGYVHPKLQDLARDDYSAGEVFSLMKSTIESELSAE